MINFSVFSEIYKCCLEPCDVKISLWGTKNRLQSTLNYLGVSMDTLSLMTQFENTHPINPIFTIYRCLLKVNITIIWNFPLW